MAAGAALAGAYIGYKLGRGKGPSYADKMKGFDFEEEKNNGSKNKWSGKRRRVY